MVTILLISTDKPTFLRTITDVKMLMLESVKSHETLASIGHDANSSLALSVPTVLMPNIFVESLKWFNPNRVTLTGISETALNTGRATERHAWLVYSK